MVPDIFYQPQCLAQKSFSVSGIFTNIGTMCVRTGTGLKVQRLWLVTKDREKSKNTEKKRLTERKSYVEAINAKNMAACIGH